MTLRSALVWRTVAPALLGLVIGLPLLVLSVKLPTAGVLGFTHTDFLSVRTAAPFVTDHWSGRDMGIAGIARLETPDGRVLAGHDLTVSIDSEDGFARTSIPAFDIAAGSRLSVAIDGDEKRTRLEIAGKEIDMDVIPPTGARVRIQDGDVCRDGSCNFVFSGGRPLRVTTAEAMPIEIYMGLDDQPRRLADRIAIDALQLWEPEPLPGTIEKRGAVRGGGLRFIEAPGKVEPLDRGAVVEVTPVGLVLRALEIREEEIYLQISGRVRKVAVEVGDDRYSLMPTYFDWLAGIPQVRFGFGVLTILAGGGLTLIATLAERHRAPRARADGPPVGTSRRERRLRRRRKRRPLKASPPSDARS